MPDKHSLINVKEEDILNLTPKLEKLVCVTSSGVQSSIVGYNLLGIGNQMAHITAAMMISESASKDIKLVGYPPIQIGKPSKKAFFRTLCSRSNFCMTWSRSLEYRIWTKMGEGLHLYDNRKNVLYLNADILNGRLFKSLIAQNTSRLTDYYRKAASLFGLDLANISQWREDSIGVHIRLGDFARGQIGERYIGQAICRNNSPPLDYFRLALKRVEPCKLVIYSDESTKVIKKIIRFLEISNSTKVEVVSPYMSGLRTLYLMSRHRVLVQANSTLSTAASIISKSKAIVPIDCSPWGIHKLLNNFCEINL